MKRRGFPLWVWAVYLAFFALSVPWYLPADATPALWFGMPFWVVLSLLAVGAIACFTLFVIRRYWPDER
jgi:hypothetical protein